MRDGRFAGFLGEALEALEREHPPAWTRMCRQLAPRRVELRIDGERVSIQCDARCVWIAPHVSAPGVMLEASWSAILDVIDARARLDEAIVDDRIRLRGDPDDLLAFLDGLTSFIQGAVRSPAFPALLRRFRATAETQPAAERGRVEVCRVVRE